MKNLSEVKKLANELLNTDYKIKSISGVEYTLNPKKLGYIFKFDNAKRRFGCCNYVNMTISLSKHLCKVNLHQIDGKIRDTILHEIAHALCVHVYGRVDGRGHGRRWVSIAKQIGCDGKRCYSYTDFGGLNKPKAKYTGTCPSCGAKTNYHRRPKLNRSCGNCCPSVYNPDYKIEIKQNY